MPKYRVRPIEVEARQLTAQADWQSIAQWCGGTLLTMCYDLASSGRAIVLDTPTGKASATETDWIVQYGAADFRVFDDATFKATYDPIVTQVCTRPTFGDSCTTSTLYPGYIPYSHRSPRR